MERLPPHQPKFPPTGSIKHLKEEKYPTLSDSDSAFKSERTFLTFDSLNRTIKEPLLKIRDLNQGKTHQSGYLKTFWNQIKFIQDHVSFFANHKDKTLEYLLEELSNFVTTVLFRTHKYISDLPEKEQVIFQNSFVLTKRT